MKAELTITGDRIRVRTPYAPALIDRFRLIPGRHYDGPPDRAWTFPAVRDVLLMLCDALGLLPSMLPDEARRIIDGNGAVPAKPVDLTLVDGHEFLTVPYAHQRANLARLLAEDRWILADEQGTGKTHAVANRLNYGQFSAPDVSSKKVLILCPKSVVRGWVDELRKHAGLFAVIVEGSAKKRTQALTQIPNYPIKIANYELLLHTDFGVVDWDVVVLDECIPGETLISTPSGQHPVATLRVGDEICGWDGSKVVTTKIKRTFARETTAALWYVNSCAMTAEHPVWTAGGYKRAKSLTRLDVVMTIALNNGHENNHQICLRQATVIPPPEVPRMRKKFLRSRSQAKRQAAPVLRDELFREMAHAATRGSPARIHSKGSEQKQSQSKARMGTAGLRIAAKNEGISKQQSQSFSHADIRNAKRVFSRARRQRQAITEAAETSCQVSWLENGIPGSDFSEIAIPDLLQNRCCEPQDESGSRGRRIIARHATPKNAGSEKGREACGTRMEDHQSEKQGRIATCEKSSARDSGGGTVVYNLETTTGNYFANGLLVHNCHRVKNWTAKTSKAVRKLTDKAKYVWALSGTPAPQGLEDWHGVLGAVRPDLVPSTKTAFEARYCVKTELQPGIWKISGYRNVAELHAKIASCTSRVTKDEALDLPPKVFSARRVTLAGEQARVYRDLKRDAVARLLHAKGEGTLSIRNVLQESLRLLQIVGGHFQPDDEAPIVELPEKAKLTALDELLEEVGDRQVVVWCVFRPEVELLAKWLWVRGDGDVVTLLGGMSGEQRAANLDAFQRGNARYFVGTASAGGTGINQLAKCDTAIYYSRDFNFGTWSQSQDRTHRIGTVNSVSIVKLLATGTVDEKVDLALDHKGDMLSMMLERPEEML